jgi:hypothetical protein
MSEQKATDILLELIEKVELLTALVKAQDFNIKILSNKLQSTISKLEKLNNSTPKESPFKVEAADVTTENVDQELLMEMETSPKGFRKSSRHEVYTGKKPNPVLVKAPEPQIIVPMVEKESDEDFKEWNEDVVIPVTQRVLFPNGKSCFMAEVLVLTMDGQEVFKTKTNVAGKWNAPLKNGKYLIKIKKRESVSKSQMESSQTITVDGMFNPLELPDLKLSS